MKWGEKKAVEANEPVTHCAKTPSLHEKLFSSWGPSIVCVLPEPVWPYAMTQTLKLGAKCCHEMRDKSFKTISVRANPHTLPRQTPNAPIEERRDETGQLVEDVRI